MRPDPPKALERAVGIFLPPACREEVLGDLCEGYSAPAKYIGKALRVIPFVIASRIRRTADPQLLVMEALLLYGSYVAFALQRDPNLLLNERGFLRPAIPTAINLAILTVDRAWDFRLPNILVFGCALGISFYFDPVGGPVGLLLAGAAEFFFPPQTARTQSAAGPGLVLTGTTKGLVWVVAAIFAVAVLLLAVGLKLGAVGAVIVLAAWNYSRTRKE